MYCISDQPKQLYKTNLFTRIDHGTVVFYFYNSYHLNYEFNF